MKYSHKFIKTSEITEKSNTCDLKNTFIHFYEVLVFKFVYNDLCADGKLKFSVITDSYILLAITFIEESKILLIINSNFENVVSIYEWWLRWKKITSWVSRKLLSSNSFLEIFNLEFRLWYLLQKKNIKSSWLFISIFFFIHFYIGTPTLKFICEIL